MKSTINLFLLITFCIGLNGCTTNLETSMAQTKEPFINKQPTPQKSPQMEQDSNILNNDYTVAEKALNKAVLEKNKDTVRLGLKSPILDIRKKTVETIVQFNDVTFVPNLIVALQENQGIIGGGSETQVLQSKLNVTIISALEHLTKLKFKLSKPLSPEDIQEILKKIQEWCQTNEPEIQQALTAEMLERQQATPILSKNYQVAKWAFDKAVLEKDKSTIRLGLKGYSLLIKRDVVQTIKQLNDKSFVPELIKALEDNQVLMSGGSETQAEQQELNKEIISALKQLTGLDFPYLNDSSTIPCFKDCPSKAIERVLKESQEWWKIHQDKDK